MFRLRPRRRVRLGFLEGCLMVGLGRKLASMMTRRSLTVISSHDGSVLVVYQRASDRCSAASAGACPAQAYHSTVRLRQISPNGTVGCTATRVRLRAWPTPRI